MAKSLKKERRITTAISSFMLLLFIFWTAIPFYWMLNTSLKNHSEIYGTEATLWPHEPTLESYYTIFFKTNYLIFFRNSMVVSLLTTFFTVIFAALAAYAVSRLRFRGRKLVARTLVYSYLVPQSMLFISLFGILRSMDLQNTLHGLALTHLGFTIPFCSWLLMGFFLSVPVELEESALVDGCNRIGVLFRIILPISLPALAVVAFFSFTLSWNEYLYAVVFNSSPDVRTLPTGLNSFIVEDVFNWGPIMGSTFLTAIPPVIVYFIFQRWLITGLTIGAVKG